MNIHPIFVHFPIALLTVYAVFECVRFRRVLNWQPTFFIKMFLVIIGTLGAFAGLSTGELAEEAYRGSSLRNLIHIHSSWATTTTWVFVVISVSYIIIWLANGPYQQGVTRLMEKNSFVRSIWNGIRQVAQLVQRPLVIVVLALVGLIAITVTGALGGAIVYGPDVDPVVSFMYHLFVK